MNKTEPKYRRPLNAEQIQILKILYKFRFVSAAQLKKYFSKSNPGMNVFRRLETLEQQGFIAKRYFDNYRLLHKPVAYHLLPEGMRKLQESEAISLDARFKAIYKDKSVSEQFMQDSFDILDIYISLQSRNAGIKFFTKPDLNHEDYEYFPQPLPDAYIKLPDGRHYFLQVHHKHQPFFVATKAAKRYMDYFENGVWDDTGTAFPVVLFVVDTASIQKIFHEFVAKNIDDLKIYTALKSDMDSENEKVWHDAQEPDEVYSLKEMKDADSV